MVHRPMPYMADLFIGHTLTPMALLVKLVNPWTCCFQRL